MITRLTIGLALLTISSSAQTPPAESGTARPVRPPVRTPGSSVESGADGSVPKIYPAQFQATLYEVILTNQLDRVEARALENRAETAEALLKELSTHGHARILYRFDQPVDIVRQTLQMQSQEPIVTGSRATGRGQFNQIRYQTVGAMVRLSAQMPEEAERKEPVVSITADLAVLSTNRFEVAPGQTTSVVRSVSMENKQSLEYGRPRVMLAVNSTDAEQPPAMYVVRYLFER
jgi:hypothetical protein